MLTQKQSEVLNYIREYQLENGHSPTFEEIRSQFHFSSLNSVFKHLKALESKGLIQKDNKARGIKLLDDVKESLFSDSHEEKLPLYGSIPAGDPTTVEGNIIEEVNVYKRILPKKEGVFLLKVTGDSVDRTGILEGDTVIVDSKRQPRNNDIVVALVDGQNTLKKYVIKNAVPHLYPDSSNPLHSEIIPLNECMIQGTVTASFRNY